MAVSYYLGYQGSEDEVYVSPFIWVQFHIWGSWNLHRLDLPFTSCVFHASHVAALGLSVFICRMGIIILILKSLLGFSEIVYINRLAQCLEREVTHLQTVVIIEGEKIHGMKESRKRSTLLPVSYNLQRKTQHGWCRFRLQEPWWIRLPELTVLESALGLEQALQFINLAFGPSQKKKWKNLNSWGQPSAWVGEAWSKRVVHRKEGKKQYKWALMTM